jgi:hypothetical protein
MCISPICHLYHVFIISICCLYLSVPSTSAIYKSICSDYLFLISVYHLYLLYLPNLSINHLQLSTIHHLSIYLYYQPVLSVNLSYQSSLHIIYISHICHLCNLPSFIYLFSSIYTYLYYYLFIYIYYLSTYLIHHIFSRFHGSVSYMCMKCINHIQLAFF